jgi:hypothetical protein
MVCDCGHRFDGLATSARAITRAFSWRRASKHAAIAWCIVFGLGLIASMAVSARTNLPAEEEFIRGTEIGHAIGNVALWIALFTFIGSCIFQNRHKRAVLIVGVGFMLLITTFFGSAAIVAKHRYDQRKVAAATH